MLSLLLLGVSVGVGRGSVAVCASTGVSIGVTRSAAAGVGPSSRACACSRASASRLLLLLAGRQALWVRSSGRRGGHDRVSTPDVVDHHVGGLGGDLRCRHGEELASGSRCARLQTEGKALAGRVCFAERLAVLGRGGACGSGEGGLRSAAAGSAAADVGTGHEWHGGGGGHQGGDESDGGDGELHFGGLKLGGEFVGVGVVIKMSVDSRGSLETEFEAEKHKDGILLEVRVGDTEGITVE